MTPHRTREEEKETLYPLFPGYKVSISVKHIQSTLKYAITNEKFLLIRMHLILYYTYKISHLFLIKESLILGQPRFQVSHCKYMKSFIGQ